MKSRHVTWRRFDTFSKALFLVSMLDFGGVSQSMPTLMDTQKLSQNETWWYAQRYPDIIQLSILGEVQLLTKHATISVWLMGPGMGLGRRACRHISNKWGNITLSRCWRNTVEIRFLSQSSHAVSWLYQSETTLWDQQLFIDLWHLWFCYILSWYKPRCANLI